MYDRPSMIRRCALSLAAALPVLSAAAPQPIPLGFGPRYLPRPVGPLAAPYECTKRALGSGARLHLELFANRKAVLIPAGVGVRDPRFRLGRIVGGSCSARFRTLEPTGVIWFEPEASLGELFALWGQPLGPRRLLSFRTGRQVLVFRNGKRWTGDPRDLELRRGDQIVLEIGGYVRPHASFLFPP